jgi:PleD family two-component response regulator
MAEWYQHQTLQKIIADADKAMYESKKSGKNCITIAR